MGRGLVGVGVGFDAVVLDGAGRRTAKDGLLGCDILRGFHGHDEWKRRERFLRTTGGLGAAGARYDSSSQCLHARDLDQIEATQANPTTGPPKQVCMRVFQPENEVVEESSSSSSRRRGREKAREDRGGLRLTGGEIDEDPIRNASRGNLTGEYKTGPAITKAAVCDVAIRRGCRLSVRNHASLQRRFVMATALGRIG